MKSNDNSSSLLEYLIHLLNNAGHSDLLIFGEEMPNIKNGSKGNTYLPNA